MDNRSLVLRAGLRKLLGLVFLVGMVLALPYQEAQAESFDIVWSQDPAVAVAGRPLLVRVQVQNIDGADITADTNFYTFGSGLTALDGGGQWANCTFTASPPSVTCEGLTFETEDTFEHFLILDVPPDYTGNENARDIELFYQHTDGDTLDSNHGIQVVAEADLRVNKFVEPEGTVQAGETFTYTTYVDNLGPSVARDVTIYDTLLNSDLVTIQSCAFSVSQGGGSITQFTCTTGDVVSTQFGSDIGTFSTNALDPLSPDSQGRLRASFRLVANQALDLTNTVQATSVTPDPDLSNNFATVSLSVEDFADLRVNKFVEPEGTVQAGEIFTYTTYVDNLGPSVARDVTIYDTLLNSDLVTILSCAFSVSQGGGSITQFTCTTGTVVSTQFGSDIGTFKTDLLDPLSPDSQGRLRASFRLVANQALDLTNTVLATSVTPDPDLSNNFATVSLSVEDVADLSVVKTGPAGVIAGQGGYSYVVTATNDGPSPAQNVVLEDRLPTGITVTSVTPSQGSCTSGTPGELLDRLTCGLGELAAAGSATVTVGFSVDADLANGSQLENNVFVTSDTFDPDNGNNYDHVLSTVQAEADLALEKYSQGPFPWLAGEERTYIYDISNLGPSVAKGVALIDYLPQEVEFLTAWLGTEGQAGGIPLPCTVTSNNILECRLGDVWPTVMAGVTSPSVFVDVRIKAGVPNSTEIINDAIVQSVTFDPELENNSASLGVVVYAQADLALEKTSTPDKVYAGEQKRYTLTVTNNGPSDASDVFVYDELPLELTYEIDTAMCDVTDQLVACSLGMLPAGESRSLDIWALVNPGTPPGTVLLNEAVVTTTTADPNEVNNLAQSENLVLGKADLMVRKYGPVGMVNAGERLTYMVVVDNLGPGFAHDVILTDLLQSSGEFMLTSIESNRPATCDPLSGTFDGMMELTCQLDDPLEVPGIGSSGRWIVTMNFLAYDAQTLNNIAQVYSSDLDPNLENNESAVLGEIGPAVDLSITKSALGEVCIDDCVVVTEPNLVTAGLTLTYTLNIYNEGPSTARNVVVEDMLPPGLMVVDIISNQLSALEEARGTSLIFWLGNLAVDEEVEIQIIVQVPPDMPAGTVLLNDVTVTSDAFELDNGDNRAKNLTLVNAVADLAVTKEQIPEIVLSGQTVTYKVTVENFGPSDAPGAVLLDEFSPMLVDPSWTCIAFEGATCPASGNEDIYFPVGMPAGGRLEITITGTYERIGAEEISNTVEVLPPANVWDCDLTNNIATVVNDPFKYFLPIFIKP